MAPEACAAAFANTWTTNRLLVIFVLCASSRTLCAQDLVPRAYVIAPLGANAITLSSSFFDGSVLTDPTLPITGLKGRFDVVSLSYARSLSLFGRSANLVGLAPYAIGHFHGTVAGDATQVYRSGLADGRIRLSVNLRGAPAMHLREFVKWHEGFVLGTSLTLVVPIGQYDSARLINPSLNRWAFKPELGISRRWSAWALDVYAGAWFFTENHAFYPAVSTRTQAPVGAFETHLNYILKPRFWASLDGNFWIGGRSKVNGTLNQDYQRNSRAGVTVSVPLNREQSLKFSYSAGAYISIGGDYKNISVAWQYSWLTGAK
jgi:hypothetical protein